MHKQKHIGDIFRKTSVSTNIPIILLVRAAPS